MSLLDQQKNAGAPQATKPIQTEEKQPQTRDTADLTGLEDLLKSAATNPQNMANAKKSAGEDQSDPSDVTGKTDEELGLVKFSDADYKLAEEVVFKGFASKEYSFGRDDKFKVVVTTTTANEELIIDQLLSEYVTNDPSAQSMQHYTAIVITALSLESLNGRAFPDNPRLNLELLKAALKKLIEFERDGNIEKYNEQHTAILKLVKARISYVKSMPTPVLDIIAKKRSMLESMVIKLLGGGILKNF